MTGNQPKRGGDTVTMSVRLPRDLHERIRLLAERDNRSINSWVVLALTELTAESDR